MAAITASAIGIGASLYQVGKSVSDTSKAKRAINSFQSQELTNPYSDIGVSTLASDQATSANISNNATAVDTLQRGGARTVLGGIPKLSENNILLQNIISKDLEKQDMERQMLIARGEQQITGIRENREQNALLGLGQQLQTGREDAMNGLGGLVSSGLSLGTALDTNKADSDTKIT